MNLMYAYYSLSLSLEMADVSEYFCVFWFVKSPDNVSIPVTAAIDFLFYPDCVQHK